MQLIVTSQEMKKLDELTINKFGIPSRVLMENAGKGCADFLDSMNLPELEIGVVLLCGSGNNGGDGYVIARWLHTYGLDVRIIAVGNSESSPETAANRELCHKMGIEFIKDTNYRAIREALGNTGVIIDAAYGIGFKGKLPAETAKIIEYANASEAVRVAIDIPSGVDADTGYAETAFEAHLTLALEAYKYGHFLSAGRQYSVVTEVIPIGIPQIIWNEADAGVLMDEDIALLPARSRNSHKGDYGRIAVFAGSSGYTGAAFLAASAAVKSGAGLVTIFGNPDHLDIYNDKPYDVMVKHIPLLPGGGIDNQALKRELAKFDVILFGPGCGLSEHTFNLLDFIAEYWNKPAVIDADGLNALAERREYLQKLAGKPFVLTPHWGEFCRLAQIGMDSLHRDCLAALKEFVCEYAVNVLLKSHTSVYYDNNIICVNTTGNDGLAKGGSGDLLSGIIAAFLGQGMQIHMAASAAAYHLGKAAERLASKQETLSITPAEILHNLFAFDIESDEIEDD